MYLRDLLFLIAVMSVLTSGFTATLGFTDPDQSFVYNASVAAVQAQVQQEQPPRQPSQKQRLKNTDSWSQEERETIAVVERYGPSVVAVNVSVSGERLNPLGMVPLEQVPPQLRDYFRQYQQPQQLSTGSGFVVDERGRIITNYHVVAGALEEGSLALTDGVVLTVVFPGRDNMSPREVPVRVVGALPDFDLAMLELQNPHSLPPGVEPITLADSAQLRVGQRVIAIGNPFGLQSTVTTGIISAINRPAASFTRQSSLSFIQTDAAINPGNSGGPLLNTRGELIGVNSAILSPSGTFSGIGFAIPSNLLQRNLAMLTGGGPLSLARLGISVLALSDYPVSIRSTFGLPDEGVVVVEVEPGSPAERSGMRGAQFGVAVGGQTLPAGGDIVIAVGGKSVATLQQFQQVLESNPADKPVSLNIWRDDKEHTIEILPIHSGS